MSFGPSGSGGSGSNPNTAQVYLPANQGAADQQFWTSLNQLANSANAGNLPGQFAAGPAQTAATNIFANPFANQAISGAYNAAPLGTAVGQGQIAGGQALQGYGTAGLPAGTQALSTAFDPQQTLYNQQFGQNLNQTNAVNSMSGVAGTPYGAGLTNQSNQNFNNQWLNQQLGREQVGAQTYGAIGQGAGNALTAGGNLGTQGYGNIATAAGLPYAASTGQNQNALSALANYLSVANNQFAIPQQLIGDVNQYMGLGQNASNLSGQLGQIGVNQLGQSVAGGLGLANNLLGTNNAATGSGGILGGIGSLFGNIFNPVSDPVLAALGPFAS